MNNYYPNRDDIDLLTSKYHSENIRTVILFQHPYEECSWIGWVTDLLASPRKSLELQVQFMGNSANRIFAPLSPDPEAFEERLTEIMKNLRTDLDYPELPIVLGEIGESFLKSSTHPYARELR